MEDLMIKSGVIKRTDGYQAGKQAKLFTLSEKYSSAGYNTAIDV